MRSLPAELRASARPAAEITVSLALTVAILSVAQFSAGALVLGGVLAMTLSRSRLSGTWRGRLESLVALPALGVATSGIGLLLLSVPWLGASVFAAGMFLSVWLRRFGPTWSRIGSLVALPLVTLLIAPGSVARTDGVLGVIAVSLIALAVVVVVKVVSRSPRRPHPPVSPNVSTLRPIPSTRMAIQLGVAIAAAFALGFWLFPAHWTWVVLSAYLVCSGNRGRADVLHKSGLRVVGAAAGTVVALLVQGHPLVSGPSLVVLVVVLVAIGQLLRTLSYAWWAVVVTLVLSLIQSALGAGSVELLPRLLAILVGAACGLAASWFLLPIRSLGVLRRRLADLLAAMSERTDVAPAAARVDEVTPPFAALARVPFGPKRWRAPAAWVLLARRAAELGPATSGAQRKALGEARRAIREPSSLEAALQRLVAELER